MANSTFNHASPGNHASPNNGDLRPWVIALVMIAAGLALLFWDNHPSDNTPSPLVAVSRLH